MEKINVYFKGVQILYISEVSLFVCFLTEIKPTLQLTITINNSSFKSLFFFPDINQLP